MIGRNSDPRNSLLEVVAEQLALREGMPYVYETHRRLRGSGFSDGEARELLAKALAAEHGREILRKQPFDIEHYEQSVRRLPLLPWEAEEGDARGYVCDVTEEEVRTQVLDNPDFVLLTQRELRARYLRLRSRLTALHSALLPLVSREEMLSSARALGMVHQDTLVFDSETEMAVLSDHALYADPGARLRRAEAYRRAPKRPLSEEQEALLAAVGRARYALLMCERLLPETGVWVSDLLRPQNFLLMDLSLSRSAVPGLILAGHVMTVDGIHLASGAALAIADVQTLKEVQSLVPRGRKSFDEMNAKGDCATRITRCLLRRSATQVRYESVPAATPRSGPCPCGSGRKYKKCCGRRR